MKQQIAELAELEPSGAIMNGTIVQRALVDVAGTGLGLAPNEFVVLTDGNGAAEVARVLAADEEGGHTLVRVDTTGAGLAASGIRLEGLSALVGTENLSPIAGQAQRLSVAGSSNDYRPNVSVLRLNRGGAAVGFAKVSGLEAQVTLDAPLPASLGGALRVRPAVATGGFNATLTATATVLRIVSGTPPGPGTGIVVGGAASAIAAIVQSVSGPLVTVDRPLSALGGDGTAVPWQNLTPLPAVGGEGRQDTPAQLTYRPDRAGTAPAAGFIWLQGSAHRRVRRITALNYDAIVLAQALPDAAPDPYSVDRFTLEPPDVAAGARRAAHRSSRSTPPRFPPPRAFHVIAAGRGRARRGRRHRSRSGARGRHGDGLHQPGRAARPRARSVVILQNAANLEAAAVRQLRLTVTLSRSLTLGASGLEAVLLGPGSPPYAGSAAGTARSACSPWSARTRPTCRACPWASSSR